MVENARNLTKDKKSKLYEFLKQAIEIMEEAQAKVNENLKRYNIYFGNENNPGIQFNNKINELNYEFERAGLDFYSDSSLRDAIVLQFQYYLVESQEKLAACNDSLVTDKKDVMKALLKRLKSKNNLEQAEKYAEEYRGYGNTIYSFTIEKDIIDTIVTISGTFNNQKLVNGLVMKCEQELRSLGYGKLIPKLEQELLQKGYGITPSNEVTKRDVKQEGEYEDR